MVKITLFCCATSYDQAEISKEISRMGVEVNVILIPCSGKLDTLYLTKAFETGAEGVAVMICKDGDCHYLEGNMRAKKRVESVEKLLEETGLGQSRIAFIQMKDIGITQAIQELKAFCQHIQDMALTSTQKISG
jgi:F420-non-reducing hydrogenase iron-sulfur subunit